MGTLIIRLLGSVEVEFGDCVVRTFPTQKCRTLLSYLAMRHDRRCPRGEIAGELWPEVDEQRARNRLSTELWRLRAVINATGAADEHYISVGRGDIAFDSSASCWIDVAAFEAELSRMAGCDPAALGAADHNALRTAVGWYRGDLLEGLYDDWCQVPREALRAQFIAALELLMRHDMLLGHWSGAAELGRRLLTFDPLLEQVHRDLMLAYHRAGDRAQALRQFAICRELLRAQLDVEPMLETTEVYRQVLESEVSGVAGTTVRRPIDDVAQLARPSPRRTIDLALSRLDTVQALLHRLRDEITAAKPEKQPAGGRRSKDSLDC